MVVLGEVNAATAAPPKLVFVDKKSTLSLEAVEGETAQGELAVRNVGASVYEGAVTLEGSSEIALAEQLPLHVAPQQTKPIRFTFHPLAAGNYESRGRFQGDAGADLMIMGKATASPDPLQLNPPQLMLEGWQGQAISGEIALTNSASVALAVRASIEPQESRLSLSEQEIVIEPKQTRKLSLQMQGAEGQYQGRTDARRARQQR